MNKDNPISIASDLSGESVEEIIEAIGINKEQLKKFDEDPLSISIDLLRAIADETGVALEKLMPEEKKAGPRLSHIYESETAELFALIEKKQQSCEKLQRKYKDMDDKEISDILAEIRDTYENTAKIALDSMKKPVVCAFGNSDTGKSTLINYLLGEDVAETGFSPLTSSSVYYQHISDMPEYLKNDSGHNAFVFGKMNKAGRRGRRAQKFEHDDVCNNPKKAKKYLISSGDAHETIKKYSSRLGSNYQSKEYQIYEIVIFLDNDVLRELTFIDIPGFGSGESNDNVGLAMKMDSVDILFYLMVANGFMRDTDMAILQKIIKSRGTLDGLYVLATQANIIGSPKEIEKRLNSGHEIFVKWLSDQQKKRTDIDYTTALRKCFYPFDTGNKVYCKRLNKSIEASMPVLIKEKVEKAKAFLEAECEKLNEYYKVERKKILDSRPAEKKSKDLEAVFIDERYQELEIQKAELQNTIEEYRKSSVREFDDAYDAFMDEKNLVRLMEKKELQNKKKEIKNFSAYLSNEISEILSENLGVKSKSFSEKLNQFLEQYEESWNRGKEYDKLSIDFSGFDFKRAFGAGLAGAGVYGALAIWASIVAGGSNLGAYILVAKVVSALSAIGISLGGTSAVISAVASIGGPLVLGLALAVIASATFFGASSINWKQKLAKRLIKSYQKEHFKEKYMKQINQHWDDTVIAMDKCLDSLKDGITDYYCKMDSLQERIQNEGKEFYDAINDIYYTVCSFYWDLYFKLTVDKGRSGNHIFTGHKKEIELEIDRMKNQNTKLSLDTDIHEMEGLVFLNAEERKIFWEDLKDILNESAGTSIKLTDDMYFYKREKCFALYYKKANGKVNIRYVDVYPYFKENYNLYKYLIVNTYILNNDQIRYKVFDMISMAQKEILILMPWINTYGWEKEGNYGKSVRQAIEEALKHKRELKIKIMVGYDLVHPDKIRERQTMEMAEQISKEFRIYGDRFKIYTKIGTHEKRVTIDNVCALTGSYNLLSNDAPYQEKKWAADSMEILENPLNIERQRREILERAGLEYIQYGSVYC